MQDSQLAGVNAREDPDFGLEIEFVSPDKIDVTHFSASAALAPLLLRSIFSGASSSKPMTGNPQRSAI
jgi:hypothetical protein